MCLIIQHSTSHRALRNSYYGLADATAQCCRRFPNFLSLPSVDVNGHPQFRGHGSSPKMGSPRPLTDWPRSCADSLATNHGGVAAVARSGVRLTLFDLGISLSSFELRPVRIVLGLSVCVVIVIYSTGPVTTSFFTELSDVMDRVATTVE